MPLDPQRVPDVVLPDGTAVPALGLGTWNMGEDRARAGREADALRTGLDLGLTLIDTAEMYGDGGAERVVAQAMAGRRDEVFLVSKAYPHHADREGMVAACEASLERLGTDRLDLYLLHWRGRVPLVETVEAFERLRRDGKILRWGVSNFDLDDMTELDLVDGGSRCATDQVLYHLAERGIEWALKPWLAGRHVPVMAYSPLAQGELARDPRLTDLAAQIDLAPAALALAWLLARGDVIVIPKASRAAHVRENRRALEIALDAQVLAELDRRFPPPTSATPLAMI